MKGYSGPPRAVLIDVGTKDDFLEKQLKPEAFAKAASGNNKIKLQLRLQVRPLLRHCSEPAVSCHLLRCRMSCVLG